MIDKKSPLLSSKFSVYLQVLLLSLIKPNIINMRNFLPLIMILFIMNNALGVSNPSTISDQSVSNAITRVFKKSNINDKILERGVKQVAQLWQPSDGSAEDFVNFCESYTCKDKIEKINSLKDWNPTSKQYLA